MSFYTSVIYNGSNIGVGGAMQSVTTDGTTVYGALGSADFIIKIDGDGTSTPLGMLWDIRGMVVVNGYLFVLDWTNSQLFRYRTNSDFSDVINISLTTSGPPQGICTDWDGVSNTFNLYVACENGETRINYLSFNSESGTFIGSSETFDTILDGVTNERRHIVFRKHVNASHVVHKYLYVTTQNTNIIQIDITNISTPIVSSIETTINTIYISWGIVSHPTENIFYISDLGYAGGIVGEFTYIPNSTTGSITSFNSETTIMYTNSTTSLGNGNPAINGTVAAIGMGYNITGNNRDRFNLYVTTDDSLIVKLYPISGNGIGGDPHIRPEIGNLYTMDNSIKSIKLFENHIGMDKIIITGETWLLPDEELEKFKKKPKIYETMKKYTYLKTINIKCNDESITINLDNMISSIDDIVVSNNKFIKLNKIEIVNKIYSIRRQQYITGKHILQRHVNISDDYILKLSCDLYSSDRNSMIININEKYIMSKENFSGALIYESNDNTICTF